MPSIGIFDSGYGGLTIFKAIKAAMPQYNYIYLGDNARAPYGNLSYQTVYEYTWQCVRWLLDQGCELVILACNTASAKALRSIQQRNLTGPYAAKRVLGVIRPTAEVIGNYSQSKHIAILGTNGTVQSGSYLIEIEHFYPELNVYQHACPLWVPLIENNDLYSEESINIIKKDVLEVLRQDEQIDTLLLACTHYPLIKDIIQQFVPKHVNIVGQDMLVTDSLKDYLLRHPKIAIKIAQQGQILFYTTGDSKDFEAHTAMFFGKDIDALHVAL